MSEAIPEPDPTLSRDAEHSTYAEAEQEEQVPPLGTATEQTLGVPGETAAPRRSARTTKATES